MKRTPILVCCDAGAAGRVLLARRDLDLRWALTFEEARAVVKSGFPRLVVMREEVAAGLLETMREAKSTASSIVLLEEDGWSRYDGYLSRGATVLVRETNGRRILEAISE